jgi:hypothetical protein
MSRLGGFGVEKRISPLRCSQMREQLSVEMTVPWRTTVLWQKKSANCNCGSRFARWPTHAKDRMNGAPAAGIGPIEWLDQSSKSTSIGSMRGRSQVSSCWWTGCAL